ncbi:MAG: hypothetical protein RMJ59_02590 [Candidatus Nitrosocaldus sp.]|nr:hypothetical protein [Candidatus Nitrosocaldus sp.]MCS7141359.1 hypothetical protein [Candidatus Nitrosocaldus sp.]MDW8000986.1 hypothetical protein [Candidatus Nitrosocaldus sp.]MDW8275256.1 hypothetical protein [Candidatus Nitrosocaldus sp.]
MDRVYVKVRYHYCYYLTALAFLSLMIIHQWYRDMPMIPTVDAAQVDDRVHQALVRIMEADSAGADTSHLVERLNAALNLMRQAEHGDDSDLQDQCTSREECLAVAADMLDSIARDARVLYEQKVRENTDRFYMNMLVYAPIAGVVSSVAVVMLYTNLKGYIRAEMMEMGIRERKEEE